jgi:uncharacterized membrane protein
MSTSQGIGNFPSSVPCFFLSGFLMGLADLVPGISGGTVAFVLGIYAPLIEAIKSIRFSQLRSIHWTVVLPILFGMVVSIALFSHVVDKLLQDPLSRELLYSAFIGLLLASCVFLFRQISCWNMSMTLIFFISFILASAFTLWKFHPLDSNLHQNTVFQPVLIIAGALAISAMLLPGISGSYLLNMLGLYPTIIAAIADFVRSLRSFSVDFFALDILLNFSLGILIGAFLFSRIISFLFRLVPDHTFSGLLGIMIGSMPALWPFWHSEKTILPLSLEKGMRLILTEPYIPSLQEGKIFLCLFLCIFAFTFALWFEGFASKKRAPLQNK